MPVFLLAMWRVRSGRWRGGAPLNNSSDIPGMSKRRGATILGISLMLPTLSFVVLTALPPTTGPIDLGLWAIPVSILGFAGFGLLVAAWITPTGGDPFRLKDTA